LLLIESFKDIEDVLALTVEVLNKNLGLTRHTPMVARSRR